MVPNPNATSGSGNRLFRRSVAFGLGAGGRRRPPHGGLSGPVGITDGYDSGPIVAQVIALGGGQYRVKVLEGFRSHDEALRGPRRGRPRTQGEPTPGRLDPDSTPIDDGTLESDPRTGQTHLADLPARRGGGEQVKRHVRTGEDRSQVRPRWGPSRRPARSSCSMARTSTRWTQLRRGQRRGQPVSKWSATTRMRVAYLRAQDLVCPGPEGQLLLAPDDGVKALAQRQADSPRTTPHAASRWIRTRSRSRFSRASTNCC